MKKNIKKSNKKELPEIGELTTIPWGFIVNMKYFRKLFIKDIREKYNFKPKNLKIHIHTSVEENGNIRLRASTLNKKGTPFSLFDLSKGVLKGGLPL